MSNSKITATQLGIWVITATAGPVFYYGDGNWFWLIPVAILLCAITALSVCCGRHWEGAVYRFVQFLWIGIMLSQFLSYSALCWPTGRQTFPVVPLTLLVLAAISASKGTKSAANGISVVFWMSLFILGIVLVAGAQNVDCSLLNPNREGVSAPMLLALLLPAAAGFLSREKCTMLPYISIAVLAIVVSLRIAGNLGYQVAQTMAWPFYEAAKSVELFDLAKRFESLVSVGVTLCNYCLYSLLLSASAEVLEKYMGRRESVIVSATIAATLMLLEVSINPAILFLISLLFWVILPLLGVLKKKEKEL